MRCTGIHPREKGRRRRYHIQRLSENLSLIPVSFDGQSANAAAISGSKIREGGTIHLGICSKDQTGTDCNLHVGEPRDVISYLYSSTLVVVGIPQIDRIDSSVIGSQQVAHARNIFNIVTC